LLSNIDDSGNNTSLKRRLSRLRHILIAEGFETYLDEERGDFTFIETREL